MINHRASTETRSERRRFIRRPFKTNAHENVIYIATRHGLRAGEVCDLRWERVDFKTASLHVRRVIRSEL
jgi:integrase